MQQGASTYVCVHGTPTENARVAPAGGAILAPAPPLDGRDVGRRKRNINSEFIPLSSDSQG